MKRTICVVTGTRAEFGLLQPLMQAIRGEGSLALQVVATGMHLSPEFGLTYHEIEAAGFSIDEKVEMLLSADTPSAVSKSMGLGLIGCADAFARLQPDLVVLLGDRFEMLAAASAALIAGIPIAHLHGGETTEGAFDEAIRHAMTKMAHLHFVAAEAYRRRVIQLGEDPARVFLVGGLGVDVIHNLPLLNRTELEAELGLKLRAHNLLVTFHPVTLEGESCSHFQELLAALDALPETTLIFTLPNADTGGRALMRMVEHFVAQRDNAHVFTSLGQQRYLSCLRQMDAVVGNSSSGIVEAPTLGVPTINIGDRQKGRLRAASILDCAPRRDAILEAIQRARTAEFQALLATVKNPYGTGGASQKILRILREIPLDNLLKKTFYNLADLPEPEVVPASALAPVEGRRRVAPRPPQGSAAHATESRWKP